MYSELKEAALLYLVEKYEERGEDYSTDALRLSYEIGTKDVYLDDSVGHLVIALKELELEGLVSVYSRKGKQGETYAATYKAYRTWVVTSKVPITDPSKVDSWSTLSIKDYTIIADQLRSLADKLDGSNQYKANNQLEAEYISETSRNLAASLEKDNGEVINERVRNLASSLNRALEFFHKGSQVWKAIVELINVFSKYL